MSMIGRKEAVIRIGKVRDQVIAEFDNRTLKLILDRLIEMDKQAQDAQQWCDLRNVDAWNKCQRQALDMIRIVEALQTIRNSPMPSLSTWDEPLPSEIDGNYILDSRDAR